VRVKITLDVDIQDDVQPDDLVQKMIDVLNALNPINLFPEVTGVNDGYWKLGHEV
jgi:hypothetical protein